MKEQETIEGNKLLAEFMGYVWVGEDYVGNRFYEYCVKDSDGYIGYLLDYHVDWNCLMTVVEKIESLNVSFSICYLYCFLERNSQDFRYYQSDKDCGKTKIESVWKACVEFVKWYNNENNKEI